jgi:hypothetical protein
MRPAHLDRIPEQFGFNYHSDPSAMLACFPPMSNTSNDAECAGDVPWLFAQLFRHSANSPVRTTDDEPVPDGSIAEEWSQSHYSDPDSLMLVPGFTWSSCHENYTSMVSEDRWSDFMDPFEIERPL